MSFKAKEQYALVQDAKGAKINMTAVNKSNYDKEVSYKTAIAHLSYCNPGDADFCGEVCVFFLFCPLVIWQHRVIRFHNQHLIIRCTDFTAGIVTTLQKEVTK